MLPVEIVPVDGSTLVLRARGSELLILPQHIGELKSAKNPKEFTNYFLTNALLNRPARKLFEAWLRKDKTLWQRIYRTIQKDMEIDEPVAETPAKKVVKEPKAKSETVKVEAEAVEKVPVKKKAKKSAAKKVAKKEKKTVTKVAKTTPSKTKKKVKKKAAEKVVKKTVKKKAVTKKKTPAKKKKG